MITANYTEFRTGFKDYLDRVEIDKETLIINGKSEKGVVVIPIEEYNSLIETLHLLGSRENAERLFDSMDQIYIPDVFEEDII